MTDKDDDFRKKLLDMFRIEAGEHAAALSSGLIELEKAELPEETRGRILEAIYRDAHSLKGAARAVDLGAIESVCIGRLRRIPEDALIAFVRALRVGHPGDGA